MFDHRLTRVEERVAAEGGGLKLSEATSVNEAVDAAIGHYAHFLRCYNDKRLKAPPIGGRNESMDPFVGATELDDGSAEAYLTAHFSIARLLTRRLAVTGPDRVADLKAALDRFTWLVKAVPTVKPADAGGDFFAAEVAMAREMTALLPERLNLVHYRGGDPGAARK